MGRTGAFLLGMWAGLSACGSRVKPAVEDAGADADADADADTDADADGDADPPDACWEIEELDPRADRPSHPEPALGFAPDGSAWIVQSVGYVDAGTAEMQVLDDSTGVWRARKVQTVVTNGYGGGLSIAFDPAGTLHFAASALSALPDPPALHVVPEGDAWQTTEIAIGLHEPSIAIGRDGTVRVAYRTEAGLGEESLGVATLLEDGSWQREVVVDGGAYVRAPAAAVAPDGTVHLAYLDVCPGEENRTHCIGEDRFPDREGDVHHLWLDADGWHDEVLASDATGWMRADRWLSVDPSGTVHLTYPAPGRMRHLFTSDGAWQSDDAPPVRGADASAQFSMTTGADGSVHIALSIIGAENDPSLVWLSEADGAWTSEVVERGVQIPDLSMAVRPDGVPCIAYYARPEGDDVPVRYACRCD